MKTKLTLPLASLSVRSKNQQERRRETASFTLDQPLLSGLKALSQAQDVSLYTTLHSALNILLYRYMGSEDKGEVPFTEYLHTPEALPEGVRFEMPDPGAPVDAAVYLGLTETAGLVKGRFDYDSSLYSLPGLAGHFQTLLAAILENPSQKMGALPLLTAAETEELLVRFNDTITPYGQEKNLALLFEEQTARNPDAIALRQGGDTLTYGVLNSRANQLSRLLSERGIRPGDNVGIIAGRGFDMIIGMYAILKAGAAYVPIDPEYPQDRQEYIVQQSAVKCVLADHDYAIRDKAPGFLRMNAQPLDAYASGNQGLPIDPGSLAYTIYTSGSTGRPKGVMIEHRMAVNLIEWVNRTFAVGPDDRLLFITSMCFDLSVYDIFGTLAAGASVVIAEPSQVKDVKALQRLLQAHGITFWDSVPTTLDYLVRDLESTQKSFRQNALRVVFLSGDWIPLDLPERIRPLFPSARVISLGGATEGTIWSNFYSVDKTEDHWNSIPYGRPLQNNFFYILNPQLQPVPLGVTGELYIGGVGVARGYAGDAEKTAYSFVTDPINGKRMYRTGDLGRMIRDTDGTVMMEFIGRRDNQVKIRGFRVELGEIESVLQQAPQVRQAVVLARPDPDGGKQKRLVGYVVPRETFDRDAIVTWLAGKLPDYMVPGAWMALEALPLTSNGKIDRNALPDFDASANLDDDAYTAPRSAQDRILVDIWKAALGMDKLGIDDHFFALGGHSLMAVQIMTEFENQTGKKLPLAILYKYPTIRTLVDSIQDSTPAKAERIWRSLVPIKPTGSKMPVYIVHGDGLNVLNFNAMAGFVDPEQPVYGLQAHGLDGNSPPFDDMEKIARHYIDEILEQNPDGPYAIGGYSFGGFVAVEMRRQLTAMGKAVKMVAIFDTDTGVAVYNKGISHSLKKKVKRQVPKFLFIARSFFAHPLDTLQYQAGAIKRRVTGVALVKEEFPAELYERYNHIIDGHGLALRKYTLDPFDGKIQLFKASTRIYFVDEPKYMGWRKIALQGVVVHKVPGDHKTIFEMPNAKELGISLQQALDQCR